MTNETARFAKDPIRQGTRCKGLLADFRASAGQRPRDGWTQVCKLAESPSRLYSTGQNAPCVSENELFCQLDLVQISSKGSLGSLLWWRTLYDPKLVLFLISENTWWFSWSLDGLQDEFLGEGHFFSTSINAKVS